MADKTLREAVVGFVTGGADLGGLNGGNIIGYHEDEVFDHRNPNSTDFTDRDLIECIHNFGQLCIDHAAEWVNG